MTRRKTSTRRASAISGGFFAAASSALVLSACVTTPKETGDQSFKKRYQGFQYCSVDAVRQSNQLSCGAAALTAVMNYWQDDAKPPVPEKALLAKYPARSTEGYPILQLREMAIQEGLAAFALTMDSDPWAQLGEQIENGRPVICAVNLPRGRYWGKSIPLVETLDRRSVMTTGNEWMSHYVVVMGRTGAEALLMDPKYGIVRLRRDEFLHFWRLEKYAALVCSSM